MEHYLFFKHSNSTADHPYNCGTDFTVELPKTLYLDGRWECGIIDIYTNIPTDHMYICCNICGESYAENTLFPVLRAVNRNGASESMTFATPIYVPITSDVIKRIRIYIRGDNLTELPLSSSDALRCTLHLRNRRHS